MPGHASTLALPLALALAVALAACGGKEAAEDAPALLGTGIPAAAPNATGVQLDPPPATPAGPGVRRSAPAPAPAPGDDPPVEDPFGTPEPPSSPTPPRRVPAGPPPSQGTQL